jgi:TP901 family phage tail tape measure protein
MSRMSLDTAIRLSAEVKGSANITKVQRSLQDLAKGSQVTARQMGTLRSATFQYARANNTTIAGIRNSVTAFRGLQEQAKIGSREFTRYGAEIQKLEGKLRGLDGTAQKAGASLGKSLAAGLATAGVGRGLQNITAQFGRFDSELRKAAAIEGGAGSFGILKKEIEAVASVAAGTPTEVAALATAMSRAGFSADQTAQSLRGIVLGAEATDIAFADMGGIVGTILKTFQMNASQTGAVVDSLVKSANSADQTVRDVGEAMSYAAGQASALGVSVDDTLGLIALLADAGVKGSRAGTTLATGFNRIQIAAGGGDSEIQDLIRGSAKMIAAMDQLGASVLDAEGKLKPMNEVLINIKRQMQGLSTTDQAIFVKALFGQEAGRGFLAVLQRSEEDISKMISQVNNAGGTAEKTREKMRGFDDSVKILGGNMEYLTNQIGGMIGAALKPLIDGLNTATGAAQKLPEPVKAIGSAAAAAGISVLGLVAAVAAIKATLAVVGGLSVVMGALSASFATVAGAATAAWAAITGPVGLAVLAIAGVTAAAYAMSPPFKEFVDEIPGRFEIFWQDLQRQGVESFNQISAGLIALRNLFDSAITAITNMVPEPVRQIVGTVQSMYGALANVADQIRQAFFNAFAGVENRFRDMVFSIIDNSNPLFAMLRALNVSVSEAAFKAGTVPIRSGGTGGRGVSPKAFGSSGATAPVPVLPPATGAAATRGAAAGGGGGGGARQQSAEDRIAAMPFGREIIAAAKANSIDPALFAALVAQESGFNPTARGRRRDGSFSGAFGLAQLMPGTARDLGVNPRDPMQNLMGGAKYLRQQMDRFGLEGGLRAYNQGPGAQQRTPGGNSQESREYPGKVLAHYERFAGSGEGLAGLRAEGVQSQAEAVKAMQDQQKAAAELLATEDNRLKLLQIADPLQKQIAESVIKQLTIQDEYGKRLAESKSAEETRSLELAQQNALQSNTLEMESSINDLREDSLKPLRDIVREHGDRLAYEREYGGLLATGINPELAKQFMEIDRIAQASKISLETQIARLEVMAAELPVDDKLRKSLEDQVKLKRELLGLVPEGAAEAKDDATETARVVNDREKQQADAESRAERLKDLYGSIGSTLEEGLIGAIQTGIDGLIDGTQRLDESLKEILSGVLSDIANQLLRFAVNTALKAAAPGIFADGGVFGGGSITPFANGGVVNEPTMFKFSQGGAMQNGLLGEAGPEAILPLRRGPDGRLGVDASGMAVPFQATPAAAPNDLAVPFQATPAAAPNDLAVPFQGATAPTAASLAVPFMRSGNSSPAAMAAEAARAMASTPLEPIRLQVESQVINRVEYATVAQLREAADAAALAGRDSAYEGMRNNPSIQRSLGMR